MKIAFLSCLCAFFLFVQAEEMAAPKELLPIAKELAEAEAKAKDAYEKYVSEAKDRANKALEAALKRETAKGDLEASLAIKRKIEELKSVNESVGSSETAVSGPTSGKPDQTTTLYMMGDGHPIVRLNGSVIAKPDDINGKVAAIRCALCPGDIITVAFSDEPRWRCFYLMGQLEGSQQIISSDQWHQYIPEDQKKWWEVSEKNKTVSPAVIGWSANTGWDKRLSTIPGKSEATPIRSDLVAPAGDKVCLVYRVPKAQSSRSTR